MSKKYRTRNYVLLGIGILVLFVPSIISIFHVRDAASLSDKVPKEYSNLFKPSIEKDIKLDVTFNITGRHPISMFTYKGYYYVFVYRTCLTRNIALSNLIKDERKSEVVTFDKSAFIPTPNFKLSYSLGSIPFEDSLFLVFDCDALEYTIKNDSAICYSTLLNSFVMKYSGDGKPDIYIENTNKKFRCQFNLLFLKKGNDVYFMAMTPIHEYKFLEKDSIKDLMIL